MIAVLDVSAAIQIILKKDRYDFFKDYYEKSSWIIAPDLYISEITNTLWKYKKASVFTHEECQVFVQDGVDLIDDFIESKELWKEVLGESIKNDHPAYDLFYAVLARRNDGILLSNDKDLIKVCKKIKIETCG